MSFNDTTVYDDGVSEELKGAPDRVLFFYNFDSLGVKDRVKNLRSSRNTTGSRFDLNGHQTSDK